MCKIIIQKKKKNSERIFLIPSRSPLLSLLSLPDWHPHHNCEHHRPSPPPSLHTRPQTSLPSLPAISLHRLRPPRSDIFFPLSLTCSLPHFSLLSSSLFSPDLENHHLSSIFSPSKFQVQFRPPQLIRVLKSNIFYVLI